MNWSEPLGEQIKGYMALQMSRRLRRGHSDGIHTLTLGYAASHSIVNCQHRMHTRLRQYLQGEDITVTGGHCCHPILRRLIDKLPINTWRQYHFHLSLIVYQRLDCPDFRTLNVNVLQLVDSTGLAASLAASIDKIVLQSQYLLSIFQLRYATSHSGTT